MTQTNDARCSDDDDVRMALTYTENISQITKVLGDTVDAGEYLEIVGGCLGEFESKCHQSLPEISLSCYACPTFKPRPGGPHE